MFNNMKNKIREKTGTDIPKFVPNSKLSVSSSRQGSETSLNSLSCPMTDVSFNSGAIIHKTSDFREIDESSYNEWLKKEEDFQKILHDKEKEWKRKEQDFKDELDAKKKELSDHVKQVEDYKSKLVRYQEDKDQLEQYQLQEMSKIKHLLLAKEKECSENAVTLKENLAIIESLKHEITRLRPLEEQISNYESSTESSDSNEKYHEMVKELEELKMKFEYSEIQSSHTNEQLKIDVQSLMRLLEDEKLKVKELEQTLDEEQRQRDEAFLRNAQMSQTIQLAQCDLRNSQQENDELLVKLSQFELASKRKNSDVEKLKVELTELRSQMNNKTSTSELENELSEKNKTIRMLQQRLTDMKKTLQEELRNHTTSNGSTRASPSESRNHTSGEDTPPVVQPVSSSSNGVRTSEEDVNFKYLKHVIIKFLTCREYEAQHLTRAVSVLLRLSAEEEQHLRDTLDMRASWWPSRARILPR
uniref:Golgin subfamily A member 1 n=1 Tax=Cacopsylla melanoneura TaxID=428564 RepID=A0A8D8PW90_9HEMI